MAFQWKQDIINEAIKRFQGDISSVQYIGGRYKNVFQYNRAGQECILKLIPFATKDQNLIRSELTWMKFLSQQGIRSPKIITSKSGQTIEVIRRLPVPCCAISFQKAEGYHIRKHFDLYWNHHFFIRWGETMGKIHAAGKSFQSKHPEVIFEDWNEGELFYRDLSHLPKYLGDRWSQTLDELEKHPQTHDNYGIIHNNLHLEHFYVTAQGDMVIFQFHNAKNHWYLYDIAVTLYHASQYIENINEWRDHFLESFANGYTRHMVLPSNWREEVDYFNNVYQLYLEVYEFIFPSTSEDNIEEEPSKVIKIDASNYAPLRKGFQTTLETLEKKTEQEDQLNKPTKADEIESISEGTFTSQSRIHKNEAQQPHNLENGAPSSVEDAPKKPHKRVFQDSFNLYGSF